MPVTFELDPAGRLLATYAEGAAPVTLVEPVAGEPIIQLYQRAIDTHVETTARVAGYNSAAHLASYINSSVLLWADQANVFIAWRDEVWLNVYATMQMAQMTGEIPDLLTVMRQLPVIVLPVT